jgi:serine phosphatase RsbU (regulator of sigma subunit)
MLGSAGGGLLLLLIIAFTLFRSRQKEKKANATLRALNEEIQQQKAEIEAINAELHMTLDEVNEKRVQIEEQHAKIEDSIRYASRIQHAILPSDTQLLESLPPHFIHYQPREIVSGDFYWLTRQDGKTLFATVDCTGHGVPGAFMSVLGSNLLHQIVDENQITEPDVILSELDRRISTTLRQQFGGDSKDGMDVALIVLHAADASGKRFVEFAGAGRPLWVFSHGKITEYKSAKYACGGSQHKHKTYPAHRIKVQAGDRLYLFTDGPVDQFGGPNVRKLGSTQLQAFLVETASLSIEEQGSKFNLFFNDWMKGKKQLDDVLIAGVAV